MNLVHFCTRRMARLCRLVAWKLQPPPTCSRSRVLPFTYLFLCALFAMPTGVLKICARGCGIERAFAAERSRYDAPRLPWHLAPPWLAGMANPLPQPQLIQHVSGSNTLGSGVLPGSVAAANIKAQLKNVSLAGNVLMVSATWDDPPGTITCSVTDNLGHGYLTAVAKVNDATQQASAAMFYVANCFAGVDTITVTFSTATDFASLKISEFTNVALTSAKDVAIGASLTGGPTYSSGSMTTTVDNDLIYVAAFATSAIPTSITSWTAGTAGSHFRLLDADQEDDSCSQYQVWQSHGAINSDVVQSPGSQRVLVLACSFFGAFAGSPAPAGPRVIRLNHNNLWLDNGTSTYTLQMPSNGNLLVACGCFIQASPLGNVSVTNITDSNKNTWAKACSQNNATAAAGEATIWFAKNAVTSDDLLITVTLGGTQSQSDLMFYDCSGMDANPLGATATTQGTQSVTGNLTTTTITPQRPGGIVFNVTGIDLHTISASVGANFLFDAMVYPTADGTRGLDEDNGKAHIFNLDTSPITFVYATQNNTAGVQAWTSASAEFFGKPTTSYMAGGVLRKRVVS